MEIVMYVVSIATLLAVGFIRLNNGFDADKKRKYGVGVFVFFCLFLVIFFGNMINELSVDDAEVVSSSVKMTLISLTFLVLHLIGLTNWFSSNKN